MHLHVAQGHALLGEGHSETACGLLGAAFDLLGGLAMDEAHPGFQEMSCAASLLSHRVRSWPVSRPAPICLAVEMQVSEPSAQRCHGHIPASWPSQPNA